jgi:prepilin-type N-terminal cleavage/methylation domain-containing protein
MFERNKRRSAFTMLELLVVIAVIASLVALTALYFPNYQGKELVIRGADQLSQWLLTAKMQAKRDGVPTGLRLYADRNAAGVDFILRMRYIQQPDDIAQGLYLGPEVMGMTTNRFIATFSGVDMNNLSTNMQIQIQQGDYLEIYGGGVMRRILSVNNATKLNLDATTTPLPDHTYPPTTPASNNDRTNFRIIMQPRKIPAEQELKLPENIGIEVQKSRSLAANTLTDSDDNTAVPAGLRHYDILFSPSGAIITSGATNSQIILWVRDVTKDNSVNVIAGDATMITVQPRTGFIANHPPNPSGPDVYSFTKDTRSSGL